MSRRNRINNNKFKKADIFYVAFSGIILAGIMHNIAGSTTPSQLGTALISPIAPQAIAAEAITPTPIQENPFNSKSPKGIAWEVNKDMFGVEHWDAWEQLGENESGWNPYANNPSSGACGIGQALPCEKMGCENWDYECQVKWMAGYIKERYINPTKALAFWNSRQPVMINGVYKDLGNWY